MSYRSRTDLFLQYRKSTHRGNREEEESSPAVTRERGYTVLNVPGGVDKDDEYWLAWLSSLGKVRRYIHDIGQRVEQLEETVLMDQWPKISFDRSGMDREEGEFLKAAEQIKSMFIMAQRQVCLLTSKNSSTGSGGGGGQEHRVKVNAQISMNAKLNEVAGRFRAFQSAYLLQMERNAQFTSQRVSKAPLTSPTKTRLVFEMADPATFPMNDAEDNVQAKVEHHRQHHVSDEAIMAEREMAIYRIAESVLQVKEVLDQMQSLVVEQGSILDRIDINMDRVETYTTKARQRIEHVAESQQIQLHRKVILLSLIMAILFVTVLIIFK